ncbi:Aste57867_5126 [Aphanomyces stellatus]|uniref:Aste57867_5126 protein n=1 Tax=Aphanomyces stellatus TaxID=120398 RepID=A0A485KGF6_9STRA|nr:hypothetical protein As57867_005113 [Aphanomyces stellatus]VFT82206.1 Aste57867_5126 [Aphanomyces stellatus]
MVSTWLILSATAAAVLTHAQTCSTTNDFDYFGNDLSSTNQDDPAQCCTDCQATSGCKAYTWVDGTCYLKSSQGKRHAMPGAVSGVLPIAKLQPACNVERDVDYFGNDLSTTDQDDPADCCSDCQATKGCQVYTWANGVCYLKSSQGRRSAMAGAVSGTMATATCSTQSNMDYVGNDIASTEQDDAANCCADCQETAGCKAYTWLDGTCYLKSKKGKLVSLPGGVAGAIASITTPAPTPQPTPKPTSSVTLKPTPSPTPKPTTAPTPQPTPKPTPSPTPKPPTSDCPRVRKSWDALTTDEKDTFVSAIELAMDKGYYQKFVFIHQERMSNREAHNTCVFLFWHRKYLLAFENMLRSLGDRYKCLMLPYWDYVQNYATMQNTPSARRCRSIEACSPVTIGLGGSTQGTTSRSTFFGETYPNNRCVTARPVNHMCVNAGSRDCAKCVPRGNWANTPMFADMGIANIRKQVLSGDNIRTVSDNIEMSPHNIMHGTLGGPMGNPMVSPMDPIFFMHHNMIDLLHTIFYHCNVESAGALSDHDQQTDPRVFEGCSTTNGETVGPTSSLRMRLADSGRAIEVTDDPLVGKFFQGLPTQYYKLTDARTLGYAFELNGLLGELYNKCDRSPVVIHPDKDTYISCRLVVCH